MLSNGMRLGLAGSLILTAASASADVLVEYNFDGDSPNAITSGTITSSPISFAGQFTNSTGGSPSITSGLISIKSTQTNSVGNDNLADAIAGNDFITFTIDNAGHDFTITKISYDYAVTAVTNSMTTYLATSAGSGLEVATETRNIFSDPEMTSGQYVQVLEDDLTDLDGRTDLSDEVVVRIYVSDHAFTSGIVHRIDNIVVEGTPEPTSLALLGLGGACLMWRRRRN